MSRMDGKKKHTHMKYVVYRLYVYSTIDSGSPIFDIWTPSQTQYLFPGKVTSSYTTLLLYLQIVHICGHPVLLPLFRCTCIANANAASGFSFNRVGTHYCCVPCAYYCTPSVFVLLCCSPRTVYRIFCELREWVPKSVELQHTCRKLCIV